MSQRRAPALATVTASPQVTAPPLTRRLLWVIGGWFLVVMVASLSQPPWPIRRGALFLHLAGLVAGFGAVLVADVHGVLWLVGRRRLTDLLRITSALQPLIWGGLTALVLSGLLLHPNISLPRTKIKLVLVLIAIINGMWAHELTKRLEAQPVDAGAAHVNQGLLLKVMCSAAISQGAWWGATLIGFLATTSR